MFISSDSVRNLVPFIPDVWEIHSSVNKPVIALPDRPPESTWAYVIAIKKDKKMQVFIYLFREQSREGVFYTYDQGEVELMNAKAVFNEALDFTGSMGFIMERVELSDVKGQREEAIKSVPAFMADLKLYKGSSEVDELVLDSVYEGGEGAQGGAAEEVLKIKGGKQWSARILSLF
ncbi:MAG: hypothetical protein M1491_06455 [Deltaproteobacteria bacterium]|nr:hypothetical protein [Deltaproteobacteria bacterium]MCL5277063.1 hypothetical protein [Deltaproteobacteria bacterium]